jgi:hypothetical protein
MQNHKDEQKRFEAHPRPMQINRKQTSHEKDNQHIEIVKDQGREFKRAIALHHCPDLRSQEVKF